MKKIFFSLAFYTLVAFSAYGQETPQDDNGWINSINSVETSDCIDSIACYSEVMVYLNPTVLIDSAYVKIFIGIIQPSGSDIYNQCYQYTSSYTTQPVVSVSVDGVLKFLFGKLLLNIFSLLTCC
jgi:hypothetical protein